MSNPLLAQVLGGLFGSALQRRRGTGGGLGGAAMGGILAGMLGGRRAGRGAASHSAVLALLLPLAMQWVQRNGGLGAVLKRMQDKGYGRQANSWVSTGDNQDIDPRAMEDVVGSAELEQLSQQLGVPQDEVKQGLAELLPEMVNQLTPDGQVRPEADQVLDESIPVVQKELQHAQGETSPI